jgi:hypothetical protein
MIPEYLDRFAKLHEGQGRSIGFLNNKLWVKNGRMIVPVGPAHRDYEISEEQAHQLLKKAPGSLLVKYHSVPKEPSVHGAWYAIIGDNFIALGAYRNKYQKDIKKGLKNCDVRQLDASFIAKYGYNVYLAAFSRYQGIPKPMGRDSYKDMIHATIDFNDIYHYWGAFYKVKLVAYMVIVVYGDEEANISVGKYDPEFLRYRSSDALLYTLSQHYLQNKSVQYINSGYRNIHHKTNVEEYVLRKFSYKKLYLNSKVTYNYILEYYLKLTFPLRKWIGKLHHNLESIYLLEEIRKKCALEVVITQCNK